MGGGGGHLPQHPRSRARPCRRVAFLRSARPSAGAERAGGRADREESRARARSGGLAQQPRDRPAGSARAGRSDRRVSARDRARSGSRQRAQQPRCGPAGQGQRGRSRSGLSSRHPHRSRALGRVQQPGRPAERPEAVARSGRLLLQGHHAEAEASRGPADCWRSRTARSARSTRRWRSSKSGCEEEPDNPIARHMLAACSGRDVPPRASDAFIETTFDSFAASFDSKLAKLQYRAPALVAEMLAESGAEASRSLDVLDAGCGTGLCGPLIAPYARRLVGVDLSESMLAQARAREVYDELVKRELTAYLRDSRRRVRRDRVGGHPRLFRTARGGRRRCRERVASRRTARSSPSRN